MSLETRQACEYLMSFGIKCLVRGRAELASNEVGLPLRHKVIAQPRLKPSSKQQLMSTGRDCMLLAAAAWVTNDYKLFISK